MNIFDDVNSVNFNQLENKALLLKELVQNNSDKEFILKTCSNLIDEIKNVSNNMDKIHNIIWALANKF